MGPKCFWIETVRTLAAASILAAVAAKPEQSAPPSAGADQLRTRFLKPPAEARVLKIIHSWPDEPEAQDRLIGSLASQNFGGVVCNVSFTDYLESQARWGSFDRAVREAKKAGFALWLYDEKGYPSATAGGLVLRRHPEWEAMGLLISDTESGGGPVTIKLPPGKPVLVAAFPARDGVIDLPARVELSGMIDRGNLSWNAPVGQWRVLAITEHKLYEGTHASMSLSEHIPYPNLLDPEPTAAFLQITHQNYATHLGPNLGEFFVSTFTDEPSLMSLFLGRMPYRVLPWSTNLPAKFQKRHGYALDPLLPALVFDAGPPGRKARYDYWHTVAELVSQNFFGQIQRWCAEHKVLSGGHLLMEENLATHVPLYGDAFRCLRRLDAPSIDCLTSIPDQVPWFIARLAASAAELEGKRTVMCETSDHSQRYRPPGDKRPVQTVNSGQIRGTCNRLICGGVNVITSYYSFAELSDDDLCKLNSWVGRCCASLAGGHQVADIAVVYPIESIWPRFVPSRHLTTDSPGATRIENIFRDVSSALFASGRDFTYVDARTLTDARVENERLAFGENRWRVVVLPGVDTLPLKAWENLSLFVRSGGVVVSLGSRPLNSETEFPSDPVQNIAVELFGKGNEGTAVATNRSGGGGICLSAGSTAALPLILDAILDRDLQVNVAPGQPQAFGISIRFTHRRIDGRELFFVINDRDESWSGRIGVAAAGEGEQWDPGTGKIHRVSDPHDIALDLEPYGAAIFRFQAARPPAKRALSNALLPGTRLKSLPAAQPLVARGEFVREEITDAAEPSAEGPAWNISATLTRSQVDTFLFARFLYPDGAGLRDSDFLVFDTWVPSGQTTPNQLLVILHEKGGADYLAATGRLLGMAGRDRTWLAPSRFQLAGWSKDDNTKLDISDITEIRVGWGGYLGSEGERVRFAVALPQAGQVK